MTCFWDGILNTLDKEDIKILYNDELNENKQKKKKITKNEWKKVCNEGETYITPKNNTKPYPYEFGYGNLEKNELFKGVVKQKTRLVATDRFFGKRLFQHEKRRFI